MNAAEYIKQVDLELRQLRMQKLGFDTPFFRIWPSELSTSNQREWLADLLVFMLAKAMPRAARGNLNRCWHWLYGMIVFLCTTCSADDHTFCGIIKLSELNQDTRQILFPATDGYDSLRNDSSAPFPISLLELIFVQTLQTPHH